VPRDLEQVVALVAGQPQRASERGEHLLARLRAAALLQARVVIGRHHGEGRDLLAPRARGTAANPGGEADVFRPQRLPAAAQEVG
jgi:hypothetical protein